MENIDSKKKKENMQWNEDKDILMLREVASNGIFTFKSGSRERGALWQVIATNLAGFEGFYAITSRGVRERCTSLMKKFQTRNNTEIRSTGQGGEEPSELDQLLQDLVDLSADSEVKKAEEKQNKTIEANAEQQKALDIRQTAMESLRETRKRKADLSDSGEPSSSTRRRSGGDTIAILREKMEADKEHRKIELERRNEFQQMFLAQQQNQQKQFEFMAQQQLQQQQFLALLLKKKDD